MQLNHAYREDDEVKTEESLYCDLEYTRDFDPTEHHSKVAKGETRFDNTGGGSLVNTFNRSAGDPYVTLGQSSLPHFLALTMN